HFQDHLLGPAVPESVQQIPVVEADLYIIALNVRLKLILDLAQVGLAPDHHHPVHKLDPEGVFQPLGDYKAGALDGLNEGTGIHHRPGLEPVGDDPLIVEELTADEPAHDLVAVYMEHGKVTVGEHIHHL